MFHEKRKNFLVENYNFKVLEDKPELEMIQVCLDRELFTKIYLFASSTYFSITFFISRTSYLYIHKKKSYSIFFEKIIPNNLLSKYNRYFN